MGRVSRQRKLKSIDPFNKKTLNEKNSDTNCNLDPENDDDSNYAVPRKALEIMKLSRISATKPRGVRKKAKKEPNKLMKRPGESKKQFFNRLDHQVGEALNKVLKDTKKLRGKRKDHLKKRDEKMKLKKQKGDHLEVRLAEKDQVKFGEVVSQPPSISSVPRKGGAKKASLDLKLTKLIQKDTGEDLIDKAYKQKKKEMTEKMKKIHEEEREKAIKEYRKMKQKKSLTT